MPSLRGAHWITLTEYRGPNHYAVSIAEHTFLDQPFIVGLELDTEGDPQDCIYGTEVWNKADGEPQIVYVEGASGA